MRTSLTFHNSWATFLQQSICTNPAPTFYQHEIQNIFTNLANQTYSTTTHPTSNTSTESITNIEENALLYVAGYIYVCQEIISQLKKWKHEHKEILLLFMSNTSGSEMDIDKDTKNLDKPPWQRWSLSCKWYNVRSILPHGAWAA